MLTNKSSVAGEPEAVFDSSRDMLACIASKAAVGLRALATDEPAAPLRAFPDLFPPGPPRPPLDLPLRALAAATDLPMGGAQFKLHAGCNAS